MKERRFYQLAYYGHNDRRVAKHSYLPEKQEEDDSSTFETVVAVGEVVGDLLSGIASIADSTGDSSSSDSFGGFGGGDSGGGGADGSF